MARALWACRPWAYLSLACGNGPGMGLKYAGWAKPGPNIKFQFAGLGLKNFCGPGFKLVIAGRAWTKILSQRRALAYKSNKTFTK